MQTVLIGTQNKTKLQEFHSVFQLSRLPFKVTSLSDLGINTEPEETGKTFRENAFIKALYYSNITKLPVLTDDGGPVIDALNGEPGVKSKLWLDRLATDEELIEYTLKRMKGIPYEKRTMSMKLCLCFYDPKTKKTIYSEGEISSHVSEVPTPNYRKGFPFRALMYIDQFQKFYDELSFEEHERINHRFHTLQTIIPLIQQYFENGAK